MNLEPDAKDKQSRIHSWDRQAFTRALLWAIGIEAFFAGLYAIGYVAGGPPPTGAPHNFPHPLILLFILFHLPAIFTVGALSPILVLPFQAALITYIIFVWLRLKKIKIRLS